MPEIDSASGPAVTIERRRNQLMFRFKTPFMILALGLIAPICAYAANFCVAVNGGFGSGGGTSYIAPAFTLPAKNNCAAWSGFTKTASTVIAISTGTGCLSNSGKVLTLSIFNTDPEFFGAGAFVSDQIQLCPKGVTGCPITGQDFGNFGGNAVEQTCTASLLRLPTTHD
jgi:hypothetical protein